METLLETLSKLKESGVILSDYTRLSTKEMFVQPIAINRLIRRLGDISGKPVAGIDVNKLYGKVTAAVKGKNKTINGITTNCKWFGNEESNDTEDDGLPF